MRVLFAVRNFWYLKFYAPVLRALAARGHHVHVVADRGAIGQTAEWTPAMEALAAEYPNVSFSWTPERVGDTFYELGYWLRRGLDYVRFLEPHFASTPVLRRRAEVRAPRPLRLLLKAPGASGPRAVRLLQRALASVDDAITPGDHLDELLRAQAPDAVVVTPLVALGSRQFDLLRAARRAGIPNAVAVGSWDHLSSKVLIHPRPHRLFVWNETQRQEAVRYHGIAAEQVVVTGAQCFDEWFDRRPSRDRDAFCAAAGLPGDRPLLLYVCSALFEGSPSEAQFVARWVAAVRGSRHEALRRAAILVRPHPKRGHEWDHVDLRGFDGVSVWPPRGEAPLHADSKDTYFDSLYHASAVVGLNTSALIEGGILDRPVYTVLLPEFHDNQEGTLHFRYLLETEGGLLHAGRTLEEHLAQLAEGLERPEAAAARNRPFIRAFVRPHGLDRPATDVFADAVEALAASRSSLAAERGPHWAPLARAVLRPVARALRGSAPDSERLWRQARYREKARRREQERADARRAKAQHRQKKRNASPVA